jgi:hypothetical protein
VTGEELAYFTGWHESPICFRCQETAEGMAYIVFNTAPRLHPTERRGVIVICEACLVAALAVVKQRTPRLGKERS